LQVEEDYTYGLPRNRISCAKCGLHIGYIYNENKSKNKRYTVVGAAVTWGEEDGDYEESEEEAEDEEEEEEYAEEDEDSKEVEASSLWRKGIQYLAVVAVPVVFGFLAKKYSQ